METYKLEDGSHVVITGGDDNAIAFTRIRADGNASTLIVSHAHAAAVTGLATASGGRGRLLLVTTSIDQRVKVWHVNIDTSRPGVEGIAVQHLENFPTAVADVSSLALYGFEDGAVGVLVCGVGMDMWRLRSDAARLAVASDSE